VTIPQNETECGDRLPFDIGVLDFCPVGAGASASAGLRDVLSMVELAERLGFSRYWIGEHHSIHVSQSTPEVLLPVLAGVTERIKVGTGGVLLRYVPPVRLAMQFALMERLFPGRIELGLAGGSCPPEVAGLFEIGGGDYRERFKQVVEIADSSSLGVLGLGRVPPIWLLGSSQESARIAGECGAGLCVGLFGPDLETKVIDAADEYRRSVRSGRATGPGALGVAVTIVCAETNLDAERIGSEWPPGPLTPTIVGDPSSCGRRLREIGERCKADHVLLLNMTPRSRDRVRCLELLSTELLQRRTVKVRANVD